MAFEGFSTGFLVLKKYYTKIFKSGSLTLAILIPLTVFLSELGYLDDSIIHIITTTIIFIGLVEVLFNIFMNKYEATKVRLLKLKIDMAEQDTDILQNYIDKEQTTNEALKKELAHILQALKNRKTDVDLLEVQSLELSKTGATESVENLAERQSGI